MATKLSLLLRKNIKEYDERMNESKQALQEASGLSTEVTFDCDFGAFGALCDKAGYTNRGGEYAYDVLQALERNVKSRFEDETSKAALQAAWTTGVVRLAVEAPRKGGPAYHDTHVTNGDIVITMVQLSNVGDIGSDLLSKLGDASGLSLKAALDWKKYEEERTETIHKIQETTQLAAEVTLDLDQIAFATWVDAAGYKDRCGEYAVDYLKAISNNFERAFKEDELARTALQNAWTTGVLRIDIQKPKKNGNSYHESSITNGDLVLTVYQLSNVGDAGSDLPGKLGDDSGLSLKAAQDWKRHEEQRTETLQKLQSDAQLAADVTLDIDQVPFAAFVDKAGYKDRVGEYVFDIINALQRNLESKFKDDDIARAALQSAWTTGVVRLVLGTAKKGDNSYHKTAVENGDLVVTMYQLSNVGDIGSELINTLEDPATALSLKSALDVKKYEEERTELLVEIQTIVGLASEVTFDLDWKTFDALCNKLGYKNRVGEYTVDIVKALRSNLKRMCEEELTKEAISESWTTGVLRLAEDKKVKNYHSCDFVDGDLVIGYKPENALSNVGDIGRDIESKL